MADLVKQLTSSLAWGIEVSAAIIIGLAALEAVLKSIILFFKQKAIDVMDDPKEKIRLRLGRWLALGLEFELAADILKTGVAPTWNEIGQLAAIVILRTVLNFFLQQEIDKAVERRARVKQL